MVEDIYTTLRARTGRWEPDFIKMVEKAYGSEQVPQRFHDIAMRKAIVLAKERRIRDAIAACECGCDGFYDS